MYRVIKRFEDLTDGRHVYNPGDVFPRDGLTVEEARFSELLTDKNRRKIPLIAFVPDDEPKPDFMNPPEEPVIEDDEDEDPPEARTRKGRRKN